MIYDGTYDVELTCDGMEGLKMIVTAGSMRKPEAGLGTTPLILSFRFGYRVHLIDSILPIEYKLIVTGNRTT